MRKILSYILTTICYLLFFIILVIFHVAQVIALNLFGEKARQKTVVGLTWCLIRNLHIMGTSFKFHNLKELPVGRPIIIVSNHQSLYDIPAVFYIFRKVTPQFVAKTELGNGLPSISYHLKKGNSALIDRDNGTQSIKEILKLGKFIQKDNESACIFPEGTRSKDGKLGEFKTPGVKMLLRAAPDAIIIPFVVKGHDKMVENGMFPLSIGTKVEYTTLEPIDPKGKDIDKLINDIENKIKHELGQ